MSESVKTRLVEWQEPIHAFIDADDYLCIEDSDGHCTYISPSQIDSFFDGIKRLVYGD